jgi:hypothetical protein
VKKIIKYVTTFIISLVIAYFIVGWFYHNFLCVVKWVEGTTEWDKFRCFYITDFRINIFPALILAGISTFIVCLRDIFKSQPH